MKRILIFALIFFTASGVFAQRANEVGTPEADRLGQDTSDMEEQVQSIDKFERDGFWRSSMSPDDGHVTTRLFPSPGSSLKEDIPEEEGMDIPDDYVLGTRVDFIHRGHTSFTIYPTRPIPIDGITKLVSVWAIGRSYNHGLVLLLEDFFGRPFELFMGKLNFQGWKQLTVAIPPQADDGLNGIVQRNYHYNNYMGIKIRGFRVDVDPMEAYGSYYVYLDDLRVSTDLSAENYRDPDDVPDGW